MSGFGLSQQQLDLIREIFQRRIDGHVTLKVWIFGSRARGTHRPYSDLDLLLEATPPLSETYLDRLNEDFEESELPYKVDLVPQEKLLDAYRGQVMTERKPLFQEPT
jgi:uncharacterized protein